MNTRTARLLRALRSTRLSLLVMRSGVPVHATDRAAAAERILGAATEGRPFSVHLCNVYVLALAERSPEYASILADGDLNLADGAPVRALLRLSAAPLHGEPPSGTEVMMEVLRRSVGSEVGHFLYGAGPGVAQRMADRLRERIPGVRIVGVASPPFRDPTEDELDALATDLAGNAPCILWVGTGTPRQDAVVHHLHHRYDGPVVPVGAAFDFVAGTKRRAPAWMRRSGLEWLHRLASEPRRLWRRYLLASWAFAAAAPFAIAHGWRAVTGPASDHASHGPSGPG